MNKILEAVSPKNLDGAEEEKELEIEEMDQSCRSLMVHHTQQLDLNEYENDFHAFDLENPEV